MIAEEFCPVSDDLLGRLYRASPDGLAVLVKTVAPATRAALAYYCSRRAHLEQIGFVIATTCREQDLYDHAGRAGLDLFARATAQEPHPDPADRQNKRSSITLAANARSEPLSAPGSVSRRSQT
jgi:hypothetical protein